MLRQAKGYSHIYIYMQLGNGCLICASQQNSCCCFKKEDIMPKPLHSQKHPTKQSSKNFQKIHPKTLDPPWGKITIMYFLGLKPKSYHNSIQTQQLNTKEIEDTHTTIHDMIRYGIENETG